MQTQLSAVGMWTHALQSEFDVQPFAFDGDPDLANVLSFDGRLSYRMRNTVGVMCQPGRILEVGCGAGYGAAALLSAVPRAAYVGVDSDAATGQFDYAREMLPRFFPHADLRFVLADSGSDPKGWLDPLAVEGPFDMVVVDGDKSYAAFSRDLANAYRVVRTGGFLVLEGFDSHPGVRRAVMGLLCDILPPHLYCRTRDGLILINVFKK